MAVDQSSSHKLQVALDLRWVVVGLLIIIGLMLVRWQPWRPVSLNNQRTISVTGETKLTDKPDEYVFYPSYPFKNENKEAALAEMTTKSKAIVSELKKLGVADSKIKTDSSNYDYPIYYDETSKQATYTLTLTITVNELELAQNVQDYLLTTTPSGVVTPQAQFSTAKRKALETKARTEATKEARAKAEQSAKNLGFKIKKVKSVDDGSGFGIYPYAVRGTAATEDAKAPDAPSMNIQPGENDLNYSVTVVYYID